ncbi:MAG: hypothetical protein ABSE49_18800 [Polyangiaceae bacterium]
MNASRRDTLAVAVLLLVCTGGVAGLQPRLAKTAHDLKEAGDVFPLPPPAQLHAATLGWDAAVVDLLWANLLVDYGTHWHEHREFLETPKYADAILELEPTYAPLYKFIDTMLAYRPLQGTDEDVRMARAYLERGTRARPDDGALWMSYGQFIAFIAPSFLHDPAEIARWRKDGADAMGHAVELGGDPERALTAATLLTEAGSTQAAIRYLQHAYAFTEHPSMQAVHDAIGRRLTALEANGVRLAADAASRAIDERWQSELPFLSRDRYLMLGPSVDPLRCAGLQGADEPACRRDWEASSEPP